MMKKVAIGISGRSVAKQFWAIPSCSVAFKKNVYFISRNTFLFHCVDKLEYENISTVHENIKLRYIRY